MRGPAAFLKEQRDTGTLPSDGSLSIAVASPLKMPVPRFNLDTLRPFTRLMPTTLADLSARLPANTRSDATAEGTHVRCFRKLMVWAVGHEPLGRTGAPRVGKHLQQHYAAELASLAARSPPPWRHAPLLADGLVAGARRPLRVVLERRPNAAARQFLELDELVGECNRESSLSATAAEERGEDADVFSVGDATDGRHSSHVECMAHTFGKSLVEDMLLMRSADVLVAPHGAGQMNAIFLPSLAALLEVRGWRPGYGRAFRVADGWHPEIAYHSNSWNRRQNETSYLWYGLVLSDQRLVRPSDLEAAGFYPSLSHPAGINPSLSHPAGINDVGFASSATTARSSLANGTAGPGVKARAAAPNRGGFEWIEHFRARRDVHLLLRWGHLRVVLGRIASIGRNVTQWKLMFGRHLDFYHGLMWEVRPDGKVARHPRLE